MNIMCALLVAIVYVIPADVESYLPNSFNICYSFSTCYNSACKHYLLF